SPYLLQHAHNPVFWYPWCDEAFELAMAEDKPVFLSVGYSVQGRHKRPYRRRLREVFHRQDMAGAPLRENALR
ncbi:MAG: DUF255 domain-containing protein, partial [Clostridiales bacterium]|nr:DUF255 domain-containing protein [Clostridiales bacterium]